MDTDTSAEILAGWIFLILSALAWVLAWIMECIEQSKHRKERLENGIPDQWRQRNRMSRENVRVPR
jgi:hypothetical protein